MKIFNNKLFRQDKGLSLIEVLVGIFLLAIVSLGIYSGFVMALKTINYSKAKVIAATIVNEKIEVIKNYAYNDVGTDGGIPSGDVLQTETITRNGIEYTVRTTITYVDDPFDGIAPADSLPNDYKRIKATITWTGLWGGEFSYLTDVAPRGLESTEGTGNLLINAFDALGSPVPQAEIHIVNNDTNPVIDVYYFTDDQGKYLVAGAPTSTGAYEITVTKNGYSLERTYGTDEVVNPAKSHVSVLEGKLSEISFPIDLLGSFSIDTKSPWGSDSFFDTFVDSSQITQSSNITVADNKAELFNSGSGYESSGYLISTDIEPASLSDWHNFIWSDNEPANTNLIYQVFFTTSTQWNLIPEVDLPGNAAGFDVSPIDLSSLDISDYFKLRIRADLSTTDNLVTPSLFDWELSWITDLPTSIPFIDFNLQGEKEIGTDAADDPVYKYSQDFTTNGSGHIEITDLEWDLYNITISPSESLDLVSTDPVSDPAGEDTSLLPDTNQSVILFLEANNSLLVKVRNVATADPIFSSAVRLRNAGLSYDETQYTDSQGIILFIPLESATYSIDVTADGYDSYSGVVSISGDNIITINLTLTDPE